MWPQHSTRVTLCITSTWQGNRAKLGQDWASPVPPGGRRGRQGAVGAGAVGVLLLAPPAQRQEQELEAILGERHKEQMGLAWCRGAPSPLPAALPQGSSMLGAPGAWVPSAPGTPSLPCPSAWPGSPAPTGAQAGGPGAVGGARPGSHGSPPGAHVRRGDFSRSRWSREE